MSSGQNRQPTANFRRGSMASDGRNGSGAASTSEGQPQQHVQPWQDKNQGTGNSSSIDGRSVGPISPPLGTASSSASSFVFPVRSVFANMQQPGRANPSNSQGASLSRMASITSNSSHRGNRSHSLATSDDGAEAIRGHAESITQMLESASNSNLSRAPPGQRLQAGFNQHGLAPSPQSESSGAVTERVYSAPLHRDGEQPPSASYFNLKGRRSSDGSTNISPIHDMSRVPTRSPIVTESAPHAYGQVDPVPQEARAPGLQTTEQCSKNPHDKSNEYRFSDRPGVDRESDQKPAANPSGKIDAHDRIGSKRDDSGDKSSGAISPKTHGRHDGVAEVEVPIHADHNPTEPDVGPAIDRPTDMTDIVRLGDVGGSRSSANSKSGSASQAQRPTVNRHQSVDHQQSVRNFVNKQAQTENMPDPNAPTPTDRSDEDANDYLTASQSRNRSSSNMAERDGILGLGSPDHGSDSDEDVDMTGNHNQVAVRDSESQSQLSENTADEPVMTVRFEHVTTEDGHHVVVGREGKLQKCEDEVRPFPRSFPGLSLIVTLAHYHSRCSSRIWSPHASR
jgi:hypothetical protein